MTTLNGSNQGSVAVTSTIKTTAAVTGEANITTSVTANTVTLSETAINYIRAKTIDFTVSALKPNTQYHPFFNKTYVGSFCSTVNGQVSSALKTNALGEIKGKFYLPANTFLAGSYTFQLVDNIRAVNGTFIPDSIYGSAEAQYEANGVLKTQQTQITLNSTPNDVMTVTSAPINIVSTIENNVNVNIGITVPAPPLPPVEICEAWYFEYAVATDVSTKLFTITTNSASPPPIGSVAGMTGAAGAAAQTISYVSTRRGTDSQWNHVYIGRTRAGTGFDQNVGINTYRVEWVGRSSDSRPSLENFRPSGLSGSSTNFTIVTSWTLQRTVACPLQAGLGSPQLVDDSRVSVRYYDPVAQSFFVDAQKYPTGMFVTSVGVYFRTVDQSTPVILEIRNMVNGLPGSQVFPGGRALLSGYAISQSPDATVETVFRFDTPIYLESSNEYCFVIRSSSLGYNLWCSKTGEIDVTTGKVIDTNPFIGSAFFSENNYTWTPDQSQDVKFNLYAAQFDTSKTANIIAYPQSNPEDTIYYGTGQTLPLSFISTRKGTKELTITIPVHGLSTGDSIVIDNIGNANSLNAAIGYNNILAADINGTHTVTVVNEDTVTIVVGGSNNATKSGPVYTSDKRLPIDTTPPIALTSPVIVDAVAVVNSNNLSPSTLPASESLEFPVSPVIATNSSFTVYTNVYVNEVMVDYLNTELNQTTINESISIATGKSFGGDEIPYSYQSFENIPEKEFKLFDEPRMIATPVNELGHASELLANRSVAINVTMTSSDKNISPIVDVTGMSLMTKTYIIDNQNDELETLTLESEFNNDLLNSEINPGTGNALAKYKTIPRTLVRFSNKIAIFVVANCPAPAVIDAYVRLSTDIETHRDRDWIWVPINGVFGTQFRNSSDRKENNEWLYEITSDEPFNVYDVKLVMRSTNNSIVPMIYNVRTITQFV